MSKKLHVAIVHYHLRPGGVTRVIFNAVSALPKDEYEVTVIVGERPGAELDWPVPVKVVEGLAYADFADLNPERLVERMEEAARDAFPRLPDVWHIHNHSLGKNMAFAPAVSCMARKGYRLLLQIHDFAEDHRPANYSLLLDRAAGGDVHKLGRILYPSASHVHYAALNQRDNDFLAKAGVPDAERHLLPNAIALSDSADSDEIDVAIGEGENPLFLYPVRAIRRKNTGEFLLWAALDEGGGRYAVTLPPKNPKEVPLYERWVELARRLNLPLEFGVGGGRDLNFMQLLRSAHCLVSTSIQEGFGMSFLEPWLVPRPIAGRNLVDITAGIEGEGINLGALYQRLDLPLEWIGRERFTKAVESGYAEYLETYRRWPGPDDLERALAEAVHDEKVDFAQLDVEMQMEVIARTAESSASARSEIDPPRLQPETDPGVISRNASLVKGGYNLDHYRERLASIYQQIMASPVETVGGISAQSLLDQFLAPERFHLLLQ